MKLIIALAFAAVAVSATDEALFSQFAAFAGKYGKTYDSIDEYQARMQIFADNLARIEVLNQENNVHGVTKFFDMTPEEFKNTMLMPNYQPIEEAEYVTPNATAEPNDVDWRTKGAVTRVKDQGRCGSCWAFSATEAIESYAKLSGKYSLTELSPQQINSCDRNDGGCNGGNTETAFRYVASCGGIQTEADYPYTSGTGRTGTCKFDASKVAVKITGYKAVARGETNLENALQSGPVSVCLAADAFQTYHSGILTSCPGRIDHCVQAVGSTASYWIVRNSWGTGWGEAGFIRVAKGSNLCHIADDVTYPTF